MESQPQNPEFRIKPELSPMHTALKSCAKKFFSFFFKIFCSQNHNMGLTCS